MSDKSTKPKTIPFFPDLFVAELTVTIIILAVLFLSTIMGYSAPLEEQADPFVTPQHSAAPWYFLFLQGLLKITPKLVGAFIVPVLIVGGLFALPFLDKNPATARRNKITLILVIITCLIWVVLTYMGSPAYGLD